MTDQLAADRGEPEAIQGVRVTYTTTATCEGADVHVQCRAELEAARAQVASLTDEMQERKEEAGADQRDIERLRLELGQSERQVASLTETIGEWQEIHGTFAPEPPCRAEMDVLKAQVASLQAVVEAAQSLFGMRGERFGMIHHYDCQVHKSTILGLDCDCGAQQVRAALAALPQAPK